MPADAHSHDVPVPRALLAGCAALAGLAIVVAGIGRLTGAAEAEPFEVASSVALRFEDGSEGAVLAINPDTGEIVKSFASGDGGFVRIAVRALAGKRLAHGGGPDAPFELVRTTDGLIALQDPHTGERIALTAFGRDNAGAFEALLTKAEAVK